MSSAVAPGLLFTTVRTSSINASYASYASWLSLVARIPPRNPLTEASCAIHVMAGVVRASSPRCETFLHQLPISPPCVRRSSPSVFPSRGRLITLRRVGRSTGIPGMKMPRASALVSSGFFTARIRDMNSCTDGCARASSSAVA